jgi:hypothetical protein
VLPIFVAGEGNPVAAPDIARRLKLDFGYKQTLFIADGKQELTRRDLGQPCIGGLSATD